MSRPGHDVPVDPGFREAWDIPGRLWGQTAERARRLQPELLYEPAGEWPFIETLRHLVRHRLLDPAGDRRRSVALGPLDLPWDEVPDSTPVVGRRGRSALRLQ